MAFETLRKLWKNEYFQTAITVALLLLIVLGGYYGAQAVLGTPYPALAVASGSMLPTLNIGDLIIVQKIDPAQIKADPYGLTGDILVYRRGDELIVHRAVKVEERGDLYYITTRGDNSGVNDIPWPSTALVGKVIARIPYVGNLPLLMHSERNMYILFLLVLVILIVLMLPSGPSGEEKEGEEKTAEKSGFSKINWGPVFYIVVNVLIVGLIIFSLWGSYTFWQPGANPPWATIRGIYADLQYHEEFGRAHLSQGFLAYRIDCEISSGIRIGIQTFAWYQFFALILVSFNLWKLYSFLKLRKARRVEQNMASTALHV
ncbi:MAG: signal peptidase I [Candidatus Bathyarchaeia archaeon]